MITDILFGLGFVAIVEGLVLALAPSRLEQVLEILRQIGHDRTRTWVWPSQPAELCLFGWFIADLTYK